MLNNDADAEDITQEAFIDAFSQLAQFKGNSTFGAWLKKIVVYKCLNFLKKGKLSLLGDDLEQMEVRQEEPIDEAAFEHSVTQIKEKIQLLPIGYRTVLVMHLFENYKHDEIAEMLNLAHSTVRTQYIRGKEKLLQLLKSSQYA